MRQSWIKWIMDQSSGTLVLTVAGGQATYRFRYSNHIYPTNPATTNLESQVTLAFGFTSNSGTFLDGNSI